MELRFSIIINQLPRTPDLRQPIRFRLYSMHVRVHTGQTGSANNNT